MLLALSLDFLERCFLNFSPTGVFIPIRFVCTTYLIVPFQFWKLWHFQIFFYHQVVSSITWSPPLLLQLAALLTLLVIVIINIAIGILPHVDNFAHIGGFLTGFLLGFILLLRPQFGWLEQRHIADNVRIKSKYKTYQYVLWIVSLFLLIAGWVVPCFNQKPMTNLTITWNPKITL